jgi:hypothetical protein
MYRSTLSGAAYGSVTVNGSANSGSPQFSTSAVSAGADQPCTVADSSTGGEVDRSCGTQGTNSSARASSSFTPQPDPAHRAFGFGLTTDAFGRGGFWRGKDILVCSGSYDTVGQSSAQATGEIRFIYNATPNTPDRLIIRTDPPPTASTISLGSIDSAVTVVNGKLVITPIPGPVLRIPVTPLQMLGPNGSVLKINFMGDNMIVDLPTPGPYTARASLSTSAGGGGGCADCGSQKHAELQVSIQSMRDALSLGYTQGSSLDSTYMIPLPIFVDIDTIQSTLVSTTFTNNGRWFPCPQGSDCYGNAGNIYLENPKFEIDGAWVVIKLHLDGTISGPLGIPIHTYGNITAYGVPIMSNNVLQLQKLHLETVSDDWVFRTLSSRFHDSFLTKLQAKAKYDLSPKLAKERQRLNKDFPMAWGSVCLSTDIDSLALSSVTPKNDPDGINANFKIGIKIIDVSQCKLSIQP